MVSLALLLTILILALCCVLSHGKLRNEVRKEIQNLKDETLETIRRLRR